MIHTRGLAALTHTRSLAARRAILPNLCVSLLGRRIDLMTLPNLIAAIDHACVENLQLTLANYNVHAFNLSMQLPWFYEFNESADITICDGMGILYALRWMGLDLPVQYWQYRISYTLLMPRLLELCHQEQYSIFLLGSSPHHLQQALERLQHDYPGLGVAGHHGYFSLQNLEENQRIVEQINRFKPQILVIGMGMPRQEEWVRLYRKQLAVNVVMTGGAVIDRLAGVVPDCPPYLSNTGLEWLYRLCQEPKRLAVRYLLGNPVFVLQIALAKFYGTPLKVLSSKLLKESVTIQ